MRSLLAPGRRPESAGELLASPQPAPQAPSSVAQILADLQAELREHGIAAEPDEIAQAIWRELSARPLLCKGLLAAYLLGE